MLYAQIESGASLLNSFYLVQGDNHMVLLIYLANHLAHVYICSFPSHTHANLSYIYLILFLRVSYCIVDAPHMFNTCWYTDGNIFQSYIYPYISIVPFCELCVPYIHFTKRSCPIFPWIPGMFQCSQLMRIIDTSACLFISSHLDFPISFYSLFTKPFEYGFLIIAKIKRKNVSRKNDRALGRGEPFGPLAI